MKFTGLVVASVFVVILITACNRTEPVQSPSLSTKSSTVQQIVEFTKPTMIIIQDKEDNYRINDSKKLESLIIKANELSIEIAIMPPMDLKFNKTNGGEIFLDQKAVSGAELILFNGNELLLTTPDTDLSAIFNIFYKSVSSEKNHEPNNSAGWNKTRTIDHYSNHLNKNHQDDQWNNDHESIINALEEKIASHVKGENSFISQTIIPVIVTNPVLNSYLWPYSEISLSLENDLFSNTDRYFTNGVRIRYSSPSLAFWRINSILPVSRKGSMEYNSIELNHEMYTPFTTKLPPVLKDDRPYASALYVRFLRRSENAGSGLVQEASFDIGVIGKASLGGLLQKGVHAGLPANDEPLGWETQIGNDLILNYRYVLKKHLLTESNFHTYTITSASLGTFNTSASTGIGFNLGTSPYFISPLPVNFNEIEGRHKRKLTYSLNAVFTSSIVGHNATLSGGLLNKNNIYVLEPREIERLLFSAEAGFNLYYQNYGLRIAQQYITREFKKGKHHFWGEIGLSIGL